MNGSKDGRPGKPRRPFINLYPVQALRSLSLADAALALAGALGVAVAGIAVFHLGLRRYQSGNLLAMRD
jgi:hypothetical protein